MASLSWQEMSEVMSKFDGWRCGLDPTGSPVRVCGSTRRTDFGVVGEEELCPGLTLNPTPSHPMGEGATEFAGLTRSSFYPPGGQNEGVIILTSTYQDALI